jgi:hypothetical protein
MNRSVIKSSRSSYRTKLEIPRALTILIVLAINLMPFGRAQSALDSGWKSVEEAMGRPGQMQPGGVIRFGMPRKDLHVAIGDVALKPGFALGSWVAFLQTEHGAMVMGDLVLVEGEIGPVMRRLEEGEIEISALHNHLLGESPHVMYMHIAGHGDAVKMAHAIHDAIALTRTPGPDVGSGAVAAESFGIDQKPIEEALGRSGKVNGGVLQFGAPRAEAISENGMVVPPAMGVATAINFEPTGGAKAAITGDFVLLGREVNPVMKALRENGIEVTALHNHMLMEEPRLFFMHFWANDDAVKLAKALRTALDLTNSKR